MTGDWRRTGRWTTLIWVVGLVACAGQPTSSVPPAPPALAGPHQVSGVLVSNQTRAPIAGATMTLTEIGGAAATTSVATGADGRFMFSSVPGERMWLSIAASGHLDRLTFLQVTGPRQDVVVDMISSAPPFSLGFFRQFARNGFEQPAYSAPLQPWSINPSFYVRTVVEDTGEVVPPVVVEGLRRIFTNAVPELSGGALTVQAFESGEASRPGVPGWVNVMFVRHLEFGGQATVGGVPAGIRGSDRWIKIKYAPEQVRPPFSYCETGIERTADHEIVHTMGFFHTDDEYLDFQSGPECLGAGRPERVRYHAAIMYSRAHGNLDPDRDHFTFAIPANATSTPVVVSCPMHVFR